MGDDEDDWVGTPPEGRYSRDRADPDFWRRLHWQAGIPGVIILAAAIVLVVVLLSR
ncbi:MAG TPA: hypothetical protein VGG41_18875 [Solirubrobacteraceae bacterium]